MEYMFFGLPIVAYDLTEHRVSALEAAVYADPVAEGALSDAIDSLLGDSARRTVMSDYGAKRVREKLVWQHSVPPLLEAYERIPAAVRRVGHSAAGVLPTHGSVSNKS
jgi:glycosyltransferase involved in cell wall biosynthesis